MEKIPKSATEVLLKHKQEIYNEVIKDFPFLKGYCHVDATRDGDLRIEIHDGNKDPSKRKYIKNSLEIKIQKLLE